MQLRGVRLSRNPDVTNAWVDDIPTGFPLDGANCIFASRDVNVVKGDAVIISGKLNRAGYAELADCIAEPWPADAAKK